MSESDNLLIKLDIEKTELDEKLHKLEKFIDSEEFKGLDIIHQNLLKLQEYTMISYSNILEERIKWLDDLSKKPITKEIDVFAGTHIYNDSQTNNQNSDIKSKIISILESMETSIDNIMKMRIDLSNQVDQLNKNPNKIWLKTISEKYEMEDMSYHINGYLGNEAYKLKEIFKDLDKLIK